MNYECDAGADADNDVGNDVAMMLAMSFLMFHGSKLFQVLYLHKTLLMHGDKLQTKWKCMNILYPSDGSNSTQIPNHLFKFIFKNDIEIHNSYIQSNIETWRKNGNKSPIINVMVKYPKGFVRS
jgi:hypothetical protein